MMKNKIIAILAALFVSMALTTTYTLKKLSEAKEMGNRLEKTISSLNQEIKLYKIKVGDTELLASTVDDLSMTKKNLQARCDELMKELKLKPKEVHHYSEVETFIRDTVVVQAKVDEFGGINARYADEFANISVNIDSMKQAFIDYSIKDSLTIFNHQKKHSILFGLIKWYGTEKTTIVNHNPKATVTKFQSINIIK